MLIVNSQSLICTCDSKPLWPATNTATGSSIRLSGSSRSLQLLFRRIDQLAKGEIHSLGDLHARRECRRPLAKLQHRDVRSVQSARVGQLLLRELLFLHESPQGLDRPAASPVRNCSTIFTRSVSARSRAVQRATIVSSVGERRPNSNKEIYVRSKPASNPSVSWVCRFRRRSCRRTLPKAEL